MLLAIDTSTAAVTAAVGRETGAVLADASVTDARRHGEVLAGLVAAVCREAGDGAEPAAPDEVIVGVGPGPFTGLRVGIVTASVFGLARSIPVTGVCSLDGLAHDAAAVLGAVGEEFLVATDARRREVYWARYRVVEVPDPADVGPTAERAPVRAAVRVHGPSVGPAAEIGTAASLPCVGAGARLYPDALRDAGVDGLQAVAAGSLIRAVALRRAAPGGLDRPDQPDRRALLGDIERDVEPLYLRRPDAVIPGPPKPVGPTVAAVAPTGAER